ncbi:hypothetical protein B0H17DRAFT_1044991, partial [Mycena rosella]
MNTNVSPSPSALAAVAETQDNSSSVLGAITNAADAVTAEKGKGKGKERLLPAPGRKPRISRSRVIAKLASQRVASSGSGSSSIASSGTARKSLGGARVRSSLGAKVQRGSLGGIKNTHGFGPLGMDAKKRARQSEYYARRKSRAQAEPGPEPDAMQV